MHNGNYKTRCLAEERCLSIKVFPLFTICSMAAGFIDVDWTSYDFRFQEEECLNDFGVYVLIFAGVNELWRKQNLLYLEITVCLPKRHFHCGRIMSFHSAALASISPWGGSSANRNQYYADIIQKTVYLFSSKSRSCLYLFTSINPVHII